MLLAICCHATYGAGLQTAAGDATSASRLRKASSETSVAWQGANIGASMVRLGFPGGSAVL